MNQGMYSRFPFVLQLMQHSLRNFIYDCLLLHGALGAGFRECLINHRRGAAGRLDDVCRLRKVAAWIGVRAVYLKLEVQVGAVAGSVTTRPSLPNGVAYTIEASGFAVGEVCVQICSRWINQTPKLNEVSKSTWFLMTTDGPCDGGKNRCTDRSKDVPTSMRATASISVATELCAPPA